MQPTHNIPHQLKRPEFRFYLIKKNSKLPVEKEWNIKNNYNFDSSKLLKHRGNYGVCTGYGNLFVIDFDDMGYYYAKKELLPYTFTIKTAKKKMYHLYYILNGKMFAKVGIDNMLNKRMCDLQGDGVGVVGPGSIIDRNYYEIVKDIKIETITMSQLLHAFPSFTRTEKKKRNPNVKVKSDSEVQGLYKELVNIGLKPAPLRNRFHCPFHESNGMGNLALFDDGHIHCFHCSKHWRSIDELRTEMKK